MIQRLTLSLKSNGIRHVTNGAAIRFACPVVGSSNLNSTAAIGRNGGIITHCFAHGCSFLDVARSLGLQPKDFFVPSNDFDKAAFKRNRKEVLAVEALVHHATILKIANFQKTLSDSDLATAKRSEAAIKATGLSPQQITAILRQKEYDDAYLGFQKRFDAQWSFL